MLESLAWLPASAIAALVTYLLHSTLLLLGAWLVIRLTRTKSHALTEQIWKSAAIAGLITTSVHLSLGVASPVFQLPLVTEQREMASPNPSPVKVQLVEAPRNQRTPAKGAMLVSPPTIVSEPQPVILDRDVPFRTQTSKTVPQKRRILEGTSTAVVPSASAVQLPTSISPPRHQTSTGPQSESHAIPQIESNESLVVFAASESKRWLTDNLLDRLSLSSAIVVTLFVIVALLGRLIVQTVAFRRRVARLQPLESEKAHRLLDELMRQAGIRHRVGLYSSNIYSEPVAFGIVRWRIVLPVGLDEDMPADELRALLAHELAHLVRGDTGWLWIGHVLCSLFAFQPLNFLARKGWRRAAEFQCDDWAVGQNVAPLSLARCLMRVAERRQTIRQCAASLAAVGSKSTLSNRVERLVEETDRRDRWQRGRYRRIVEAAILITISGLAIWGPSATMPARSESPTSDVPMSETIRVRRDSIPARGVLSADRDNLRGVTAASNSDPKPGTSADDEIERLSEEMNELADETVLLAKEVETRPELRPTINKLAARIDQLRQRIHFLHDKMQAPLRADVSH